MSGDSLVWGDLLGLDREIIKAVATLEAEGREVYCTEVKRELDRHLDRTVPQSTVHYHIEMLVDSGALIDEGRAGQKRLFSVAPAARVALENEHQELTYVVDALASAEPLTDGGRSS
jgi:DNA-binding transcriptional ArsR family regulator